jgi:hypothetical protein
MLVWRVRRAGVKLERKVLIKVAEKLYILSIFVIKKDKCFTLYKIENIIYN